MTVTTDRAAIEQAIVHANESAKRMHDSPKFYERVHAAIDQRLTEWEAASER